MKKAIILAAAIAGCCQNEGQQTQSKKLVISDTLRIEKQFEKIFCINCGAECKRFVEFTGDFESTTGKALYRIKTNCPNSAWYNDCQNSSKEFNDITIYNRQYMTEDDLKEFGVTVEE